MNSKDFLLVGLTTGIYGALTWWQPCLTTFCKSTSFPSWLSKIVYSIPIPFAEKFIIALILMLPLMLFSEGLLPVLATVLLAPLVTVIIKYAPKFEPTSEFVLSVLFDYAFVAIALVAASSLIFFIKIGTSK